MVKSFGILKQTTLNDDLDKYVEELSLSGYAVMENMLTSEELNLAKEKLDTVYTTQVNEFSNSELANIQELYLARLPFLYDDYFIKLFTHEKLIALVRRVLGNYFILHLQNGIINMPDQGHHQNSWHRDLPYQDFTISNPLAISALYCLDDFNESTGGTIVLPATHKTDCMPSDNYIESHSHQVTAKAGSVILFDSMIFHKAGYNSSQQIRRGINHMFTSAIIKQQISIPDALNGKYSEDPFLRMLFGYDVIPLRSVVEWRKNKMNKTK